MDAADLRLPASASADTFPSTTAAGGPRPSEVGGVSLASNPPVAAVSYPPAGRKHSCSLSSSTTSDLDGAPKRSKADAVSSRELDTSSGLERQQSVKEQRKLRNRAAAQESRNKKQRYVAELEESNWQLARDKEKLGERVRALERENAFLTGKYEALSSHLRTLIGALAAFQPPSAVPSSQPPLPAAGRVSSPACGTTNDETDDAEVFIRGLPDASAVDVDQLLGLGRPWDCAALIGNENGDRRATEINIGEPAAFVRLERLRDGANVLTATRITTISMETASSTRLHAPTRRSFAQWHFAAAADEERARNMSTPTLLVRNRVPREPPAARANSARWPRTIIVSSAQKVAALRRRRYSCLGRLKVERRPLRIIVQAEAPVSSLVVPISLQRKSIS